MRRVKTLTDIEIDEVSLVDKPANQFAKVAIAKRDTDSEETVSDLFDENGDTLDMESIQFGDVVYDDEGNAFEVVPDEVQAETFEREEELEPVGKSLADAIREDLSKAVSDSQRDEVISKALAEVDTLKHQLSRSEEIAKSERDLRLTREYIEVAKGYNVPIASEELGPVLMRMAESMSNEDCGVIHKALTSSGAALFDEVGYVGKSDNVDPFEQIDEYLDQQVSKSDSKVSKADAMTEFFADNPSAYDEYLANRRGF
jgi:hypothetical protein